MAAALTGEESAEGVSDAERLEQLCAYLTGLFTVEPDAGATAWDALTQGKADSEGAALGFEACCRTLGYDCVTAAGRLDGEPHFWNIITLGGRSFHTDISAVGEDGELLLFLQSDEALLSRGYWWDNSVYPVCEAPYTPAEGADSGEPAASEDLIGF